ncbi:MAG: LysM peptidoglycan-binding domain-containing protein [Bacteroidota bacterium]
MMRKTIAFLLILIVNGALMAQEPALIHRSTNKVIIEGKVYYIHIVEPGQTLYSIARAYNVSQKDIVGENPGADAGLRVGQVIKIPYAPVPEGQTPGQTGRAFTVHTLRQGETIYAVSRLYGMNVEAIEEANPGIDIYHLQIGQQIRIPEVENQPVADQQQEPEQVYHKVKKKETLYSISREYGVSIDALRNANPQIGWGGPRTGEVIRIPQATPSNPVYTLPEVQKPDTLLQVIRTDTLYFPGDTVSAMNQEEYLYDELNWEFFDPGKTYRIAFFIPFNYEQLPPLDSLLKDVTSPSRISRIQETYQMDQVTPKAINFLEFYEGALLAVDSALQLGMKLEIRFYDTRRSSDRMREILSDPSLRDFDLFIGPFYSFNVEIAASYAMEQHIPLVTPFHSDPGLISSNPYLFQITPSYETECRMAARYLAREFGSNLIFVHSSDSSEMAMNEYFREQLFRELRTYTNPSDTMLKEIVLDNGVPTDLLNVLSPDRRNIVISLTANEAFASQLVTNLYFSRQNYDIELFGSPYYVSFDNIDIRYFHALQLTLAHGQLYSYSDPLVNTFMFKFHRNYNNLPMEQTRKGISYGVLGFEMTEYFLMGLRAYGPRFIRHLDDMSFPQMFTPFRFVRVNRGGGYENQGLEYYRYTKSFDIIKVQLPVRPEMHYFFRPAGELDNFNPGN